MSSMRAILILIRRVHTPHKNSENMYQNRNVLNKYKPLRRVRALLGFELNETVRVMMGYFATRGVCTDSTVTITHALQNNLGLGS